MSPGPSGTASLAAVLARREERARQQADLLARWAPAPVVCLTVVAPGPVKTPPWAAPVLAAARASLQATLAGHGWRLLQEVAVDQPTGPELLASVAAPAGDLKRALAAAEDSHPLGRLWDADVVATPAGAGSVAALDGQPAAGSAAAADVRGAGLAVPLGRVDLGLPERACLVCGGPARPCARSRAHRLDQLEAAIARRVEAAAAGWPARVAQQATAAIRVEARLTPKPGLVDAEHPGAHDDMDLALLEASADALAPCFTALALLGATEGWTVADAQRWGRSAEAAMLAATGGVNTHRGALFALGWLVAEAAGRGPGTPAEQLCQGVAARTAPLWQDWQAQQDAAGAGPSPSHGGMAWREHGLGGARAEAAAGFPHVRQAGLPAYRAALAAGWPRQPALLRALVALMACAEDTTLVHRGGLAALHAVQAWARRLDGDPHLTPSALEAAVRLVDADFCAWRWSPGGAADLLAVTVLLDQLGRA